MNFEASHVEAITACRPLARGNRLVEMAIRVCAVGIAVGGDVDVVDAIDSAEAADYVRRGIPLALQPLVGGIPPDVAWPYLERAASIRV